MGVTVKAIGRWETKNPHFCASRRPALIRKTVDAILTKNKMVEDSDADQVAGLTESGGETISSELGSGCPEG